MKLPRIAIVFIGTSVYLNFFERFRASIEEKFAPGIPKHFFVFSDNHLRSCPAGVTFTQVRFANKRDTKLNKFLYVAQVEAALGKFDYLFYLDADCIVAETIEWATIEGWFSAGKKLVGVLHPWGHIRTTEKRFETNVVSAAYVAPEDFDQMSYHQSCFWGAPREAGLSMVEAVQGMIERDRAIGHVNEHLICDEIYVNRYFLDHCEQLHSLAADFAHPGDEYERLTATKERPGYRFGGRQIIVHDNAHQTKSWSRIADEAASFTHGTFAQFDRHDLAADRALQSYRRHNAGNPVHLVCDGGGDLAPLARKYGCAYRYEPVRNGSFRNKSPTTNQVVWLSRVATACRTTLAKVDWVLLLEPDVECFRTPRHPPQYALAGPGRGPGWSAPLRELFDRKFGRLNRSAGLGRNYTGCGGSIFNRQAFLECFDRMSPEVFEEGCRLDERIRVAEDAALTFLFQINGYDTGEWEDFTEWQDENRQSYAVVHGDKRHYNLPPPAFGQAS